MSESCALVVGINDYTHLSPLYAAVDDATRMAELLDRNADKSRNYDVELLTSSHAVVDRPGLRERLTHLFASSHRRAIFYFSGHGHLTASGGFLATQDAHVNDSGIHTDELLALANNSPARSKTIILDCCHAGAAGIPGNFAHKASLLADNVTILAASRRTESAYETSGGGVFTSLCIDALEGGAANLAGDITAASLYGYVEQALDAWQQRPLMRSNVSHLCALRSVDPPIDPKTLRRLPNIFSTPDAQLALTPAHDPELDPHDQKAEAIMSDLRALLAVGLVKPVGASHLYHAALYSKACRLTPAGRQQWRLADSGLL